MSSKMNDSLVQHLLGVQRHFRDFPAGKHFGRWKNLSNGFHLRFGGGKVRPGRIPEGNHAVG